MAKAEDDQIAEALREVAESITMLGNAGVGNAQGTKFGGLEAHGMAITEAAEKIAAGLGDVADAIRELAKAKE